MSDEIWVINASPLILLGKPGVYRFAGKLGAAGDCAAGRFSRSGCSASGDAAMEAALGWAAPRVQDDIQVPSSISGWDLGAGESQVLAHCLAGGYRAVLDDGEARAVANKVHSGWSAAWVSFCAPARQG